MTVSEFYEYHSMMQQAINKDLRSEKTIAILSIISSVLLAIWIGPPAALVGGLISSYMVVRFYINKHRNPYFVRGKVEKKWSEERPLRNQNTTVYFAEISAAVNIQKSKTNEIIEQNLPTNLSVEIFSKGNTLLKEGKEVLFCFSGAGVYLGFLLNKKFYSYMDK